MMALYDKKHTSKAFERFKQMFPKEAELIKLFHKISYKTQNYLPILMQRLESKLILEIVAKEVSKRLPNAPIIPVHDSILTTEEFQLEVRDIMEEILYKYTDRIPGLTLDNDKSADSLNQIDSIVERDLNKVYSKKLKKNTPTSPKNPLLYQFPELNGGKILSTKYLNPKDQNILYEPDVNDVDNDPLGLDNS